MPAQSSTGTEAGLHRFTLENSFCWGFLAISRQFKDDDEERTWLAQIAVTQAELNQAAKANETIAQLLALIPGAADKSDQAWGYYTIGIAYRNLGEKSKAVENMKQAMSFFTEAGARENATDAQDMIDLWTKPDAQPDPKKEVKPMPAAGLPA